MYEIEWVDRGKHTQGANAMETLMETEAYQKWQADQSIFMASTLDLIRSIGKTAVTIYDESELNEMAQFQTDLESLVMTLKNL
jgi:hypothetical protein